MIGDRVKHAIREAVTYRSQGLVSEARIKLEETRQLVMKNVRIRNNDELVARIDREISSLESAACDQGDMIPFDQLPSDTRARIQQIGEDTRSRQEEKERTATSDMPSVSIVKKDRQTIPTDIMTIEVTIETASAGSSVYELDATFQDGSRLSVIIPKAHIILAEMITVGAQFDSIRYLTSNAIIDGAGVVVSCNEINRGPKTGDYSLTLQML